MKRALCTFGVGTHVELLEIARPSFKAFARRHDYDYYEAAKVGHQRPAPWYKVQCLLDLLKIYDVVVFIGADLVIVDGRENIPFGNWDWYQELVAHNTQCGLVPNDDLWVCNQRMLPWLERCWALEKYMHHGWWEQAALLELMGYDPSTENFPTYCKDNTNELYRHTRWLVSEWNVHIWDIPQPTHPRIQHATMWPQRAAIMREWAKQAEAWINE
jgi:hypothetical protein